MSNPNAKNIPVKGYLSADAFLDLKSVFDPVGLSMSSAIGLGLQKVAASIRDLNSAHRTRSVGAGRMPKSGPARAWPLASGRRGRGGAVKPPMRV